MTGTLGCVRFLRIPIAESLHFVTGCVTMLSAMGRLEPCIAALPPFVLVHVMGVFVLSK